MTDTLDGPSAAAVLRERRRKRPLLLFLDYDGTLTPIVERPELAVLDDAMRATLQRLAAAYPVYVISGRDLEDIKRLVGIDGIHYVGSHGFDLAGALPGIDHAKLDAILPTLKNAADELQDRLGDIEGILIERKKRSFALHYRLVDAARVPQVFAAAEEAFDRHPDLKRKEGKKVIEFLPDFPWDKGQCLLALLELASEKLAIEHPFPVYLGDDVTDEDAFAVLQDRGVGILVADRERATRAHYRLPDPDAVRALFRELLDSRA